MDVSLVGKRAWVGGGSAGIGLACGRALADLGASVVLVSRSVERLERARDTLAAGGGQSHEVVSVDQGSPADLERAVGEVVGRGAVHIVVHNTGGPPEGRAQVNENAEYEAAFRGHVVAARILAGACLPGMREAGYGRIINITSVSVKAPIPLLAISNTVRAALVNWSKTLSLEVAADGVTVNNVLPGLTATDRLFELIADWADAAGVEREAYEKQMVGTVPAGRFGEPEEIASAVAFLASPAGSYVNGVNLPVDGGRLPVL